MEKPRNLPQLHDIEACRAIYEAAQKGLSIAETASEYDVSERDAVKWLNNPRLYSPFPDVVALARAHKERSVYDNLSNMELHMFWGQVRRDTIADNGVFQYEATIKRETMSALGISVHIFEKYVARVQSSPLYAG